jgi:predicted nucleic acid-binding protein
LGPGESEVLTLGLQSVNPLLILDDGQARKVAEQLKLPIRGTLGILLDAKQAGLIREVKPLVLQLQQLGFRLAPETFGAVVQLAGEPPN